MKENKTSQTSSDSETKTKPALLNKYEEDHKKEVEGLVEPLILLTVTADCRLMA